MSKLVRDYIPQMIRDQGRNPVLDIIPKKEFPDWLYKKLLEEAEELDTASSKSEVVEELADIYEVLYAYMSHYKITQSEVVRKQVSKRLERGAFKDRVVLKEIDERPQ